MATRVDEQKERFFRLQTTECFGLNLLSNITIFSPGTVTY